MECFSNLIMVCFIKEIRQEPEIEGEIDENML